MTGRENVTHTASRLIATRPVLRFAPLGIPTAIIADDSALLHAATANFADLSEYTDDGDPRIVIRLRLNELATAGVGFAISVKGSSLTIKGDGISGAADAEAGTAECSFTQSAAQECRLAAEVGETLLLFLLARSGRTPLHAASIMIGETAVLLAGPSGAGKSSLALAAQRQGLRVLSEDTTYVAVQPSLSIWGWPGAIHLDRSPSADPELPRRLRGGRIKAAVAELPPCRPAGRGVLVVITPGEKVEIERVSPRRLLDGLPQPEPGFDLLKPEVEQALAAIAKSGAWRLTLSKSPEEAISLLRSQFETM